MKNNDLLSVALSKQIHFDCGVWTLIEVEAAIEAVLAVDETKGADGAV